MAKKKRGRKIYLPKKRGKPKNIVYIETVEEALKRGIKIEVLAPIPHRDNLKKVGRAITKTYRSDLRRAGEIE
jgi:DNA invertase Pin-like site-specific DNA recombinase